MLLVPVRASLPLPAFFDLWKAMIQVKAHTRRDGTQVRAHTRNIQSHAERKELVTALARKMAAGEHTRHATLASAVGAARHASKVNGKAVHVYEHPEGGWVATHDETHTEGHDERIVAHKGKARLHRRGEASLGLAHLKGPIAEHVEKPAPAPKVKKPRPKAAPRQRPEAAAKQTPAVNPKLAGLDNVLHHVEGSHTVAAIHPSKIQVDANAYQFKGGGDSHGVTDRLRSVQKWDYMAGAMNPVMVHKRNDGSMYVVDGHQRTGLARRLLAEGHDVPALNAVVFHEADGYTVGEMKRMGALANIQQGTGTAVDVAKVLRERPLSEAERATIPAGSNEAFKDGEDLARLSDEAFTYVANQKLHHDPKKNAAFGAIVARAFSEPGQQLAALQELAKDRPAGRQEAEDMVREIKAAGFASANQATLFGVEQYQETLHKPIAKILGNVRRRLADEKNALGNAIRNRARLEARGSQIDAGQAAEGKQQADALVGVLNVVHDKSGAFREALKASARGLKEGAFNERQATDAVISALEREFEQLKPGGAGPSDLPGGGRGDEEGREEGPRPVVIDPGQASMFG
jgi:hypothetical protein